MTFDARESSRQLGSPVELYLFRYGVDVSAYHAFTNAQSAITYDGIEYLPEPIGRDAISASGTLDRSSLEIRVPISNPLGNLFLSYPPSQVVTITIRQGHLDDSPADFEVAWPGRVINCAFEGSQIVLTCEPAATSMRRQGLRANWQKPCRHVLYAQGDGLCNANQATATITRTVVSVNDTVITLSPGWDSVHPAAKYRNGMVSWTHDGVVEYRTILRITGTGSVNLRINGPARGLSASDSVDIILGCNRSSNEASGDCINLHNNIENFGGFFKPKKNPIGGTSPFV